MKKLIISLAILAMPLPVLAATSAEKELGRGCEYDQNLCSEKSIFAPGDLVHKGTNAIIFLVGGLAAVFVIISGLKYALSGGDPKSIAAAKDTLTYAVVGVIVALIAASLVNFVIFKVSGGQ